MLCVANGRKNTFPAFSPCRFFFKKNYNTIQLFLISYNHYVYIKKSITLTVVIFFHGSLEPFKVSSGNLYLFLDVSRQQLSMLLIGQIKILALAYVEIGYTSSDLAALDKVTSTFSLLAIGSTQITASCLSGSKLPTTPKCNNLLMWS